MEDELNYTEPPILRIPLFPLNTVMVPGLVMPLVLFEPKYLALANNLTELDATDRIFGIVKSMPKLSSEREISLTTIGTLVQVQTLTVREDQKWDLVAVGNRKFRILEIYQDMPYLTADVELLTDDVHNTPKVTVESIESAIAEFENYRELLGVEITDNEALPDDPATLSYLITAAALFSLDEKQQLLEILSTENRLNKIQKLLRREVGILSKLRCFPTYEPEYSVSLN